MITIRITVQYLPTTRKLLYDADIVGNNQQPCLTEARAVEALMPHLKAGFFALAKVANDPSVMIVEGEGEAGYAIAQGVHDAKVQQEERANERES